MIRAQNDIYMPVSNFGAEVNSFNDDTAKALADGTITRGELQRSAMNICRFILQSPSIERSVSKPKVIEVDAVEKPNDLAETVDLAHPIPVDLTSDARLWIYVEEEGIYSVSAKMRYDHHPAAQSSYNMKMNNVRVANVQLNGTWGNWIKQKIINVHLEKGWYALGVDVTKSGLEVEEIYFAKGK